MPLLSKDLHHCETYIIRFSGFIFQLLCLEWLDFLAYAQLRKGRL